MQVNVDQIGFLYGNFKNCLKLTYSFVLFIVNFRSDALLEDGTGVIAHSKYDLDKPEEELKLPYNATITPLQVHLPSAPPRPPTLAECEVIMKHMQQTNDRQAHEVTFQIKFLAKLLCKTIHFDEVNLFEPIFSSLA